MLMSSIGWTRSSLGAVDVGAANFFPDKPGRRGSREAFLCNNPNFWEIEINGYIKIPNFGANKNFYFKYKINFLSLKLVNLSICSHASNKKNMRKVLTQML
jgi:hypothetical protein